LGGEPGIQTGFLLTGIGGELIKQKPPSRWCEAQPKLMRDLPRESPLFQVINRRLPLWMVFECPPETSVGFVQERALIRAFFCIGILGISRNLESNLACEQFNSADEIDPVKIHDEADGPTRRSASEAMIQTLVGID